MDTAAINTDVIYAAPAPSQTDVAQPAEDPTAANLAPEELAAEDLIEEVSIDGMCGVY